MAKKLFLSGSKEMVGKLHNQSYLVHVNIINKRVFNELIENGFDPEKWESDPKNYGNKVLINEIPYRNYTKERII